MWILLFLSVLSERVLLKFLVLLGLIVNVGVF